MTIALSPTDRTKIAAAWHALSLVADGMRLGLGTGSTAAFLVRLLGLRMRAGGLRVETVATSAATAALAREKGIPVHPLDRVGELDLTIDGADEFDPGLNLIKGGGGALLIEKIVAGSSRRMAVIADPSKQVATLGAFPLPVEIVRFGHGTTRRRIIDGLGIAGDAAVLRNGRDGTFVTDEGHHILDLHLGRIADPSALDRRIRAIPGVVETGLFLGMASCVVMGQPDGSARLIAPGEPETRLDPPTGTDPAGLMLAETRP
jgi:ribose 5-phosphate isomerase A